MSHSPEPFSPVLSILCGVNDVDFNASRMDTLGHPTGRRSAKRLAKEDHLLAIPDYIG